MKMSRIPQHQVIRTHRKGVRVAAASDRNCLCSMEKLTILISSSASLPMIIATALLVTSMTSLWSIWNMSSHNNLSMMYWKTAHPSVTMSSSSSSSTSSLTFFEPASFDTISSIAMSETEDDSHKKSSSSSEDAEPEEEEDKPHVVDHVEESTVNDTAILSSIHPHHRHDNETHRPTIDTNGVHENDAQTQIENGISNVNTNTIQNKSQHGSFVFNHSEAWLQGPRVGNIPLEKMVMMNVDTADDDFDHKNHDLETYLEHVMNPFQMLQPQHLKTILGQTMCYPSGRFRSTTPQQQSSPSSLHDNHIDSNDLSVVWNASDPQQVRDWKLKLAYLALHRYLHKPAFAEYDAYRTSRSRHSTGLNHHNDLPHGNNISNFDFECPHAKYLLVTVRQTAGMGATYRNAPLLTLYMALATGRIPLWIQSLPQNVTNRGQIYVTHKLPGILAWKLKLASCRPRRDAQCVFLPLTPCVVTYQDLIKSNVAILNDKDINHLLRFGHLPNSTNTTTAPTTTTTYNSSNVSSSSNASSMPPSRKDILDPYKVWIYDVTQMSHVRYEFQIHDVVRQIIHEEIQSLLLDWKNATMASSSRNQQFEHFLWSVADSYNVTKSRDAVMFFGRQEYRYQAHELFFLATRLYLMRPNAQTQQELYQRRKQQQELQNTTNITSSTTTNNPSQGIVQERQYFGLPIRGTDKCGWSESSCLPFDRYMEWIVLKWKQHGLPGRRGTVLLTSEDPSISPLRLPYLSNASFPLDIMIDPHDVSQGHGSPAGYRERADDIMISSLAVIQLQLQSNIWVGNCCSQFHIIMYEFLQAGCGAAYDLPKLECLNQVTDAKFRMCCGWQKHNPICQEIWKHHQQFDRNKNNSNFQELFKLTSYDEPE